MNTNKPSRSLRSARIWFWVRWILGTSVGVTAVGMGGNLGFFSAISITFSWTPGIIIGTMIGASIAALILGLAQKYVLLHYIAAVDGWTRTTMCGVFAGVAVLGIGVLTPHAFLPWVNTIFLVLTSVAGGVLGVAQMAVLRQKKPLTLGFG